MARDHGFDTWLSQAQTAGSGYAEPGKLHAFASASALMNPTTQSLVYEDNVTHEILEYTAVNPVHAFAQTQIQVGWQDTITKMVSLGAKGTDQDLEQVLTYLSTNFKGEGRKPLNLNTATSVDLESIGGFLRKESAAWIAYRKAQGPCKSIDDLKKVTGVDFKKVEERRERLVCF